MAKYYTAKVFVMIKKVYALFLKYKHIFEVFIKKFKNYLKII